jgi:hypothetical protein
MLISRTKPKVIDEWSKRHPVAISMQALLRLENGAGLHR